MNVRHSKAQPNWETPQEDIEYARKALGGKIDLDPFSCATGNARVKATRYFTPEDDGFKQPWIGPNLFINHPGGTTKKSWKKLISEIRATNAVSRIEKAIWIGFSVEQLCVLADMEIPPTEFSICFLRKRIHFIDPDDLTRPSRPGHANFVCGVGIERDVFEKVYKGMGSFTHGEMVD